MNWGNEDVASASSSRGTGGSPREDPLRRKVMSALASIVDKHRQVLEDHDQVVITIHLDWRNGRLRETVMALPGGRNSAVGE